MFIYFNKLGELTTIIPHGEVVRQGSWFTLNVALDDDVDISDKNMWFRYKRRGNERFQGDTNYQGHFDMIKEGSIPFKSLDPKEATFDLVDGKYYKVFSYKVNTDTGMTAIDGNVEVVFTLVTSDTTGGTEDVKMEGRANIYVEPTYGLHPERGLDLSVSEYATIMQSINQIQNSYKVKNVVVSQSENEVGDIENTITITYNDAKELTFKSMYIEKYLSDALVNTETMDLTITKSNGEVLTFSGISSEKVMKIILDNSVKGKTDIVLKTSKDKIDTPTDSTTLTSLGIYQCFGAYIINLPSVSSGTLTSEQLEILSQNRNAILMINGIAYTYSMLSNGVYSYHHISGSSEDLIYVNASTREWTTEHRTFEIGDLNAQIEQLKLDLQKKVDKIETVSSNTYAYIQYTEDGEPVQSSLRIEEGLPIAGTLVQRNSNGEIATKTPTLSWSATTKKYVDDALKGKVDKVTTTSDFARAYVVKKDGTQATMTIDANASNNTIAMHNENGNLLTTTPTHPIHCANKGYVDDALSTKADLVGGKVPASQLPAYVDDVVEVLKICSTYAELPTASSDNFGAQCICINPSIDPDDTQSLNLLLPIQWARGAICEVVKSSSGDNYYWAYEEDLRTGAVYITTEDNKTYRYTVSNNRGAMVIIGTDLALGETSSTAYAGDKGKANRDDIDAIIDGNIKVYSAIHDESGNDIAETYATKEAVDGKVDRIETSSIDGVYGLKAENSVDPFQTDSVFNPTTQLTPSTCGQYVIQYKTIIGLVSNGYGLTGLTYNITESSFTVTNASGSAQVAFRFNATAGQKYTLRTITLQSTYCAIQYFAADGTRLGVSGSIYNGNQFTVPTYDQAVAYGMITVAPTTGGNLTINKLEVVSLTASTTDTLYPVTEIGSAGTIPLRNADGCIRVDGPRTNSDAVNLGYLRSSLGDKLDKHAGFAQYYALYGVESDGTQSMFPIKVDATPYAIPQLNVNGQLSANAPTADTHVANKKYVDDAVASSSGGANGIGIDSDGYLQLEKDSTAIADQPKNVQPLAIQALVDASKKYIHINAPQYDGNEDYLNEVVAQFTRSLQYALGDDVDVNNIYYSFVPHVMTNYGIVTLDANINMTTEQNDTTGIIFGGRKSFLYKDNMMGFKDENNKQIYIDFSDIPETLEAGSGLYFAKMAIADVYGHVITQTPTEDNHATNKAYVDNLVNTAETTVKKAFLNIKLTTMPFDETRRSDGFPGVKTRNLIIPFQKDSVYRVTSTGSVASNGLLVSQYKTILGIDENGLGIIMNSYNITSNSISVVSNNKTPTIAFRFEATKGEQLYLSYTSSGATEVCYVLFYSKTGTYLDRLANAVSNNQDFDVPSTLTENDVYGLLVFKGTDNDTLTISSLLVDGSLYASDVASDYMPYDLSESLVGKTVPMRTEEGNILVATPTEDLHATTKKYVDDAIANAGGGGSGGSGANGISVDSDGYLQLDKDGTPIAGQTKDVKPVRITTLDELATDAAKFYTSVQGMTPSEEELANIAEEMKSFFTTAITFFASEADDPSPIINYLNSSATDSVLITSVYSISQISYIDMVCAGSYNFYDYKGNIRSGGDYIYLFIGKNGYASLDLSSLTSNTQIATTNDLQQILSSIEEGLAAGFTTKKIQCDMKGNEIGTDNTTGVTFIDSNNSSSTYYQNIGMMSPNSFYIQGRDGDKVFRATLSLSHDFFNESDWQKQIIGESILTNYNTKKIFGISIFNSKAGALETEPDINLCRHQLTITDSASNAFTCVIVSPTETEITTTDILTTVTKAVNGYKELCFKDDGTTAVLSYNGTAWSLSNGNTISSITDLKILN